MSELEHVKDFIDLQSKLENPTKDARNPHFKSQYVTLPSLLDYLRPILAEHGYAAVWNFDAAPGGVNVGLVLKHTGGEGFNFGELYLPLDKQTPQAVGSAITYARRYILCTVLNIEGEKDDDGNAASHQHPRSSKPSASFDL